MVRVVPQGEYVVTLKARGLLIEGTINELREELYLTRRALQYIIDCLWELDGLPTINQLHQMFYKMLRRQGGFVHIIVSRYISMLYQWLNLLRVMVVRNPF